MQAAATDLSGKIARWWIWIAVGQFVLVFAAGVAAYPGNASAPNGWLSLHLFETTYCELGKFDRDNPRPNRGSRSRRDGKDPVFGFIQFLKLVLRLA